MRTHVRHTLSCFLRHHTYVRLTDRDGVHEYVCVRCGHPLVFPSGADRFAHRERFPKKVRYACGLFGHRVAAVASRNGFVEYACHCGHSFLKRAGGERKIRHPLICFFTAHRITFLARRAGYTEFVCEDCGHPFCFADRDAASGAAVDGSMGACESARTRLSTGLLAAIGPARRGLRIQPAQPLRGNSSASPLP